MKISEIYYSESLDYIKKVIRSNLKSRFIVISNKEKYTLLSLFCKDKAFKYMVDELLSSAYSRPPKRFIDNNSIELRITYLKTDNVSQIDIDYADELYYAKLINLNDILKRKDIHVLENDLLSFKNKQGENDYFCYADKYSYLFLYFIAKYLDHK